MSLQYQHVNKYFQIANERSKSAHPLQRVTLPDNAWVIENIEDKTQAEKQKSIVELEMVKQARLESLEVIENMEIERPSSRYKLSRICYPVQSKILIYFITDCKNKQNRKP